MERMKITFICTGGSIDKDYSASAGTYNFKISEPAVSRMLKGINPDFDYEVKSVLKKDSLDITEKDRQAIYNACKESKNSKIIITHGTDTMVRTAEKLSSLKGKVIVLVGSSKPERFRDSDAQFNVGAAVGAINVLDKGVYIAMNGRIFEWSNVKKSKSGRFKQLE